MKLFAERIRLTKCAWCEMKKNEKEGLIDLLNAIDNLTIFNKSGTEKFMNSNNWLIRAEYLDTMLDRAAHNEIDADLIFKYILKENNKYVKCRLILSLSIINKMFFLSKINDISIVSRSRIEVMYLNAALLIANDSSYYLYEIIETFMRSGFVIKSNCVSILKTSAQYCPKSKTAINSFLEYAVAKHPSLLSIYETS